MEEDEQEQRRRKVEAGRAKLAHFRQRKGKGDCAHSKKKTAKRKGSAVDAPVQEESAVVSEDGRLGGRGPCKSTSSTDTPDGAAAAQECERSREPAAAEPVGCQAEEAGEHPWAVGGRPPPPGEQQVPPPAQPAATLELEALRLSLSNMHAARLELAQTHLQKEKDRALAELRDALSSRHAQELALLHSRQQLQLQEVTRRCHQETAEVKEKLQSEVERNVQIVETLKRDWEAERGLCLENLRKELSAKHQSELENLRSQFEKELAEHTAELDRISQAKGQAELSLQAQPEAVARKLQEVGSQCCRHAEALEPGGQLQANRDLVEGLQEALREAKEQIQLVERELRESEAAWQASSEALKRDAEEQLTLALLDARQQAEADRQALVSAFELREREMRQLQDEQAARLRDLEGSLGEQQGHLPPPEPGLAGDLSPQCSPCDLAPTAPDWELAVARLQEDCAQQLKLSQSRFLEQREEMAQRFTAEREACLREAQEKHAGELQLLRDRHQQHVAALTAELQHQARSGARGAEPQTEHAAEPCAVETRRVSGPEVVEALQLPQGEDSAHRVAVPQEQTRDSALPAAEGSLGAEPSAQRPDLQAPAAGQGVQQSGSEGGRAGALCDRAEPWRLACEQQEDQVLQLKAWVLSLRRQLEARHLELEQLQQTRDRENQEGANLIAMLKSDVDLCHSQRTALQDAVRRLLGLFGETLKAAVALKTRIGERVGLCLEEDGSPHPGPGDRALSAVPALEETWPGSDVTVPGLDGILPECAETSSVAEISSHLCESFLVSPESTLECEQPIRRVYQSLGLAVDGLLEMVLDSSRQLEEARQIHAHFEKEFSYKSEELAQVVRKHQELLERLEEENAAKTRLMLELHKAEGIIEGFKVEKAGLQEALVQQEVAERGLVMELESLRQQMRQVTRQQAELQHQKEAATAEAQEREAALRREVEAVTREHSESRQQSEKDRRALLAQVQVLEAELEEQAGQRRAGAEQAAELSALRQQLASLDKLLRGQRHFMDEQAAEREHERDEFQQEIRRLEEQLQQAARPQPRGPPDGDVELLQEKLREKSDELDELAIKKELAERRVLIQDEEIKHLEETSAVARSMAARLQEELEKQRAAVAELQQDKEALLQQQRSSSPPASTLRSEVEEGGRAEGAEAQVEAAQRALLHPESKAEHHRSSEVVELRSIIETLQENQDRLQKDKAHEIQQLHEVIERLQRELSPRGPAGWERGDGPAHNLQSELLCLPAGEAAPQATLDAEPPAEPPAEPETELQAREAREALSRLLAEQERQHGQALEALQQRLRAAEEAAARQLGRAGPGAALREAQDWGAQMRECEAALKAKDAAIAERELEIEALNRRASAHRAELQAVRSGLARLRRCLERQPPELQRLRAQCVRLGHQLQALTVRFLRCQEGLDKPQAHGAPTPARGEGGAAGPASGGAGASCEEVAEHDAGSRQPSDAACGLGGAPQSVVKAAGVQPGKALVTLSAVRPHSPDRLASLLAACQRRLESELLLVKKELRLSAEAHGQGKEKLLEDCKLQKVDIITQVKQLQEKLNCLVYSMSFQNIETEDFKSHALENSLSDSSSNGEETDSSLPAFNAATWDLVDGVGTQDSWLRNKMPAVPLADEVDVSPVSLHSGCSGLPYTQGAGPLQDALRAMDVSWSSPEVVRKDSTLEPLPSLPLTPCSAASLLQADRSGLLGSPGSAAAGKSPCWLEPPSAADRAPSTDPHGQRTAVEKDVEDFIITSLDSQEKSRSPLLGLEGETDGSEKSDDDGAGTLSPGPRAREVATATPASRSFRRLLEAMRERAVPAKPVEALLQMVCDESRHILALSEYHGPPGTLGKGEPITPPEHFLSGGLGLPEAAPAPQKGEKEAPVPSLSPSPRCQEPPGSLDWGEFLQVLPEAFDREHDVLPGGLLPPARPLPRPEQGDLPEASSELRLPDRSCLLSEVQALRAQLRLTHLQNQEKLQQLCAALTSAEARGSRREHRLRRQVELLAYKVEQEKCIASDLQKTLSEEQEEANSVRKLLVAEENAARALRSELRECRQDNERLLRSLSTVQQEVLQLRSLLDGKEQDLRAALQELEGVRGEERALQDRLEQERRQHLCAQGQSAQALGELRASLQKQCAQNSQLSVALKHEQTAKDNLQKELQIESSRCEALLGQERSRLAELRSRLEAEQGRSLELCEALQHERLLTERLSRRAQATPRKPKGEKAQALRPGEELRREKERELELQRQRQEHKLQQRPRTEVAVPRPPEAARLQEQQQGLEKVRQQQQDLEKVRQRQQGLEKVRLQEQQQGLEKVRQQQQDLEKVRLQEQQQGLEKVRLQLLGAAGLLSSFISQTVDRTINDWTSSNEKAVASLLQTLEGLKSELRAPRAPQGSAATGPQAPPEPPDSDALLRDNHALRRALSAAAQEKAGLRRTLTQHLRKGCVLGRLDRSACRRDRKVLHSPLGLPDPGLPTPATREEADASNRKVEKLYLHYLRAESFRKALIYQKKYLLLLIGGFQDSEQETLSMIAHLGVFPSKADKRVTPSRPFTRFRTAVRVVIAISRLRFLVRKWQEVDRKGALVPGCAPRPGFSVPQQQPSPPETSDSPPTRDVSCSPNRDPVRRASPRRRERTSPSPNSRSEGSRTASQDAECSLTEYIQHLEMIQQRLGGRLPDPTPKKSCRQKTKQ